MSEIKFDTIVICESAFLSEDKAPVLIKVIDDITVSNLPGLIKLSIYLNSKGNGDHEVSLDMIDPTGKKGEPVKMKISFGEFTNHNQIINTTINLENEGNYTFLFKSGDESMSKKLKIKK